MAETHTITINPDGSTTVEVSGVKGSSCQDATKAIEKALGATVKDTKTGEFYETPDITISHRQ